MLKFSVYFLVYFITIPCISLLSLCFSNSCLPLTLLQLRPILGCFIVDFRVIFKDLTCGFLSNIQDLRLVMHLLCSTVGHDISNNLLTLAWMYAHYLGFSWQVFRVKHVRTYVFYLFSLYIYRIYGCALLYKHSCYRPPRLEE